MIIKVLSFHVDAWDASHREEKVQQQEQAKSKETTFKFGHIYLGSRDKQTTIAKLSEEYSMDAAFIHFHSQLEVFLQQMLQQPMFRLSSEHRV